MFRANRLLGLGPRASAPAGLYLLLLFAFIAATRWPLAPHYLYYFDSANFALALENFNPSLHQPQPPGYPLFVGLARLIHVFVPSAAQVMLVAGLVAAFGATLLIFLLASEMFDRPAAILSAALLASNPVFWFGGITNEIRLFLALSFLAVAFFAWRALQRPGAAGPLYLLFAAHGVAAGFRPVESLLLLPLLYWVWFRTGRSARRLTVAIACQIAFALPWIAAIIWSVGGFHRTFLMVWAYATDQFQGTSLLFGARLLAGYRMFLSAVVWNLLGTLSWIWALPFLPWKALTAEARLKAVFLAIAFFPAFLFSAFVHIGDPDQGLGSISILCVAGGAILAAFLRQTGSRRVFAAAALVVASHALLFFYPPGKIARAASYRAAKDVDRMTTGAVRSIQVLSADRPVTIVHFGSSVAWRQLEYYFPDDYVVVLPGRPRQPEVEQSLLVSFHHQTTPLKPGSNGVLTPASRRLICLGPFQTKAFKSPDWHAYGPVFYKDIGSAPALDIGPFRLIRQ